MFCIHRFFKTHKNISYWRLNCYKTPEIGKKKFKKGSKREIVAGYSKIVMIQTCIKNEIDYMDLQAEIKGNQFIIEAKNHDVYQWRTKMNLNEVLEIIMKYKEENNV